MSKLTLQPKPTFVFKVAIPVAGSSPALVEFKFKHRSKTELSEFMNSRDKSSDVASFMGMVEGWDLDAEYNAANVAELLENYIGSGVCTYVAYVTELSKAKEGN